MYIVSGKRRHYTVIHILAKYYFDNFFTNVLTWKFAIKSLIKIPPTLPCKMLMFANRCIPSGNWKVQLQEFLYDAIRTAMLISSGSRMKRCSRWQHPKTHRTTVSTPQLLWRRETSQQNAFCVFKRRSVSHWWFRSACQS